VVEAAEALHRVRDVRFDRRVVADVEAGPPAIDRDLGALLPRELGDRLADPVRTTHNIDSRAVEGPGRLWVRNRGQGPHLDHPVGEDHVRARRDLDVDLIAGHSDEAHAGYVAQDEAAVVGCAEVAHRRCRAIRLVDDRLAKALGRLPAPVPRALGDLGSRHKSLGEYVG
jgi:hypothetical protein